MGSLLLSEAGARVLGGDIFPQAALDHRWVIGTIMSYDEQGIWFQDEGLLGENRMVFLKWHFIDAILSEARPLEAIAERGIGFR